MSETTAEQIEIRQPKTFPASFDDFLRIIINVANLTREQKIKRYRDFEGSMLRASKSGANESDISAVFYQRQKIGFRTAEQWNFYAEQYLAWWKNCVGKINRQNSGLTNIRDENLPEDE